MLYGFRGKLVIPTLVRTKHEANLPFTYTLSPTFVGRRSVYVWWFTSLEVCTKAGIEEWETAILHFGREELLWGVVVGGGVNR